jgi:hypothetical protein
MGLLECRNETYRALWYPRLRRHEACLLQAFHRRQSVQMEFLQTLFLLASL